MRRRLWALLWQRHHCVRGYCITSHSSWSTSSSVAKEAQVLSAWPVGSEVRFSQLLYVGEAGSSIHAWETEEVLGLCETLLSSPDAFQALKDWIGQGNSFSSSTLSKIYYRLARRKCYKELLQILKGVREEKMIETTETHYIWEMGITCRQHTPRAAEMFYESIPLGLRSDEVTAALIFSLAKRQGLVKSEKWIQRMTRPSTDLLNALMAMYLDRDKHDNVLETYEQMRALGLEPSIHTYLMLLTCKDRIGGLKGIERLAAEAVKRVDLHSASALRKTLNETMEVCGYLGEADNVGKIWNRIKSLSGAQVCDQSSYISAMTAFGMVRDVGMAEQLLEELLALDLSKRLPNPLALMIEIYVSNGMMAEAEQVLRHRLKEAIFAPYNSIVRGYIASGQSDLALQRLREGVAAIKMRHIRPAHKTMMALLPLFASRRDLDGAERIMFHYRHVGDASVYNELLKVYVACNAFPRDFRSRMRGRGVQVNQATEALLDMLDSAPSAVFKKERRRLSETDSRTKARW